MDHVDTIYFINRSNGFIKLSTLNPYVLHSLTNLCPNPFTFDLKLLTLYRIRIELIDRVES